jgi:hypothetical protein
MARLPYGARSQEEMHRNLNALGDNYQVRERSLDECFGDVQPAVPLLPMVGTVGILATVVLLMFLLGGCTEVVSKTNCSLYGYCYPQAGATTPQKGS